MQASRKDRIVAVAVALLLHAALLGVFMVVYLVYPSSDSSLPEFVEENSEISFEDVSDMLSGSDIVSLGDNLDDGLSDLPAPSPVTSEEPTQDASDVNNAGDAGIVPQPVASESESPVEVDRSQAEEKQGPTKEEIEAAEEAKRQQQMRQNIAERTKFGGGSTGSGAHGQADGNNATGATAGSPSVEGLAGYTLQSFGKVRSTSIGTIAIDVTVNADGTVSETSFNASRSLNTARTDKKLIERCRQSALGSRFSVPAGETRQRQGIILYHFK